MRYYYCIETYSGHVKLYYNAILREWTQHKSSASRFAQDEHYFTLDEMSKFSIKREQF